MQNHMSEKQSTHHLDKIYNAPVEGTKDWIIDSLSRKAKELEIVKSETLNKYSQVFAQSQNSIKKGLKIIDDGVNYCQEKIAKVIEATEISIFERDEILLSLSREPEEALKIVTNEISKIQVKDKVRFYALLDGDLEQLITGKISKELDEKINDLINENKRLNERLKALEEGNNDQKALDPILIQEQFDIQNKSLRDAESKLEKTIQDIEVLKNKTEKLQETISRNQKGEIGRIDEIQNPIQNQEESKEAQAGLIIDKSPASLPVQSEINYIPSDEEAEKLSSLFGFSTKVAR
mmetsp:Transcript_9269/g.9264  ORF Transcript_9269/g.9264 Transcript_9269/m.9264 type:complete len:293 (+) Transcript_9269:80-958(+)